MTFEIKSTTEPEEAQNPMVEWVLRKKDGHRVARSPRAYNTEAEARSDIAEAKKAMKGAGYAKVVRV